MAIVLAAGVVVIAMLALGASSGPSGGPVARAAYVTTQEPGFRFSIDLVTSIGAQTYDISGEGSFNTEQLEGTMNLQIAGKSVMEIVKNPFVYVKLPGLVPGGKEWAKANINAPANAIGVNSPLDASSTSPTLLLDYLKAGGQVTTVGSQQIDGVPTTHYEALADLERYAATVPPDQRVRTQEAAQALQRLTGSGSLPIDVWVDAQQRVRRFSTVVKLCSPAGTIAETISMDISDFGPQSSVSVPPESQTLDITEQIKSDTAGAVARLGC